MRKGYAISLTFVVVLSLFIGLWFAKLLWFKPLNINHFYERVFLELVRENPEALSGINIQRPFLLPDYKSKLTGISPIATRRIAEISRENLVLLEEYNRAKLTENQQLSFDILHWWLTAQVASEPFIFHDYPITHVSGPIVELPQFMASLAIESKNDIENYLDRLELVDEKFGSVVDALEERRKLGVVPPKHIIEQTISLCDSFCAIAAKENLFYTSFETKLNDIGLIDPKSKQRYLDACVKSIQEVVIPSYKRISQYLLQLERSSLAISGVWQLPSGNEYYQMCLLKHSSLKLNSDSLYLIGKLEIEQLKTELKMVENGSMLSNPQEISSNSLNYFSVQLPLKKRESIRDNLPSFRRFIWLMDVGETWSTDFHFLTNEIIEVSSSTTDKNQLRDNLFYTTKMVVDIGIHRKKWLREQAVDFMVDNIGLTKRQSEAEVDRIIVWPGRACAYKVVQLELLNLKSLAKTELKSDFDIKEFQEVLSSEGAMPLDILENRIIEWIELKKGRN